jgi:hypothetical protein
LKDKEINSGPWKNISVASLLHPLPLPLGRLVAIGYQTIAYYNKDVQHAIDPPTVKVYSSAYTTPHQDFWGGGAQDAFIFLLRFALSFP